MIGAVGILLLALPASVLGWLVVAFYLEHRSDRIPILLYHRLVRKADAEAGLVADEEPVWASYDTVFAAHMDRLRSEGWTTLDFDDYLRIRSGQAQLPPRPVLVTFDDGYLSNYTLAYPVLRRNGQKATIFVALEPDAETRDLVAGLDGFLTPDQMKEMSENGISIQSHSLTHPILTELPAHAVDFELAESRRRLEAITGRPVRHLAIPRAGYSRRIRSQARAQGYATVCCNNKGTSTGLSDPLALPRIVIDRDMGPDEVLRALEPRSGFLLRIIGNVKRIPERLGGVRFAQRVRALLYHGPLRQLFTTQNLKRAVVILLVCSLGGGLLLALRLLFA